MRAVLDVLIVVIDLYTWVIIASVVMSWLVAFNIVNTRNNIVAMIWDMLGRVTEPLLAHRAAARPVLPAARHLPLYLSQSVLSQPGPSQPVPSDAGPAVAG
jgi:YggT family protein